MQRYVAFLRGMNLGKRRLAMSELKRLFEQLEFKNVETFIASGNVLFTTAARHATQLEERIAQHLETGLGYPVDTFIRTGEEVANIGLTRHFPEEGQAGITVHVGFLHHQLAPETSRQLNRLRTERDKLKVDRREYYWLCRVRTSESELWKLPAVRALRLPSSTMRNMTSIRKLVAKHALTVSSRK